MVKGPPEDFKLEDLQEPGDRYVLGRIIGSGVSSTVYEATDNNNGGKKVAVKIVKLVPEYIEDVKEEYRILNDTPEHPNLPIFYGAYCKNQNEVWFVIELCEGGAVIDLIKALIIRNRHLSEEHLAFILKGIVRALNHLHKNKVMHRDIRGNNILLANDGTIKLVDFGLSRGLKHTMDKRHTCVGSPCWMAPELITSNRIDEDHIASYDSRIDVWALGITAIELADGKAPFEDMHPTRAIFQIVRNPPPSFQIPSKWSQLYTDFVTECLVKNAEERPFIFEFEEHPFLTSLPEQHLHLGKEMMILFESVKDDIPLIKTNEVIIRNNRLQRKTTESIEELIVEDLSALEKITEDTVLNCLRSRYNTDIYYTYMGDVLLFLNPNKELNVYGNKHHLKYKSKSRSDNAPHIYGFSDGAYQDMLHHNEPQHILLTGETCSGKTSNYDQLMNHLLFLGGDGIRIGLKIRLVSKIIQAFGNAATPHNANSTRHVLNTQVTFTKTGKLSGAIFWLYQLEKMRVTGLKSNLHSNFHIFYYLYDGLNAEGLLKDYYLQDDYKYRYLPEISNNNITGVSSGVYNTPKENAEKYKEILRILTDTLEFEGKYIETILRILAAVLLIGEITFNELTEIENPAVVSKVATLLNVEDKKLSWSLCNYCVVQKGAALQCKHSQSEATEAKHVFARGLYARLVDWIINMINLKLSLSRVVMGDKYYISLLDIPGFESYQKNDLEQLFVNTINEQLQYFYSQRIFALELKEQEEEGILLPSVQYYDNKPTIDELIGKPDGLLYVIDEASRSNSGHSFILDTLANSVCGNRVRKATATSFTVAHYVKKVEYNAKEIPSKNQDFLPPELIETLSCSNNNIIKQLFVNLFTRAGNLTISAEQNIMIFTGKRKKWGAALVSGDQKSRKFNTEVYGEYNQSRQMRTLSAVFRAMSIDLLKALASSKENGNVHFVRCIRTSVNTFSGFEPDIVSIQLRSLAVVDSAKNRQNGYSYRVSFKDFIERYKYLAFDFDEEVEVSRENCRLLLIRLKMEGWIIGKNKVFLRYYDKEYLSRFYETHVKKITKIQAMMRSFLTKRKVIPRLQSQQSSESNKIVSDKKIIKPRRMEKICAMSEDEAATIIQKKFREFNVRQEYGPLLSTGKSTTNVGSSDLVAMYVKKWRAKSIFQVLLLYRAHMFQELTNFSQQVHLYSQNTFGALLANEHQEFVNLDSIDESIKYIDFIGEATPIVFRLPFTLNHHSLYNTDYMFDPLTPKGSKFQEKPNWDSPIRIQPKTREHFVRNHILNIKDEGVQTDLRDIDPENENEGKRCDEISEYAKEGKRWRKKCFRTNLFLDCFKQFYHSDNKYDDYGSYKQATNRLNSPKLERYVPISNEYDENNEAASQSSNTVLQDEHKSEIVEQIDDETARIDDALDSFEHQYEETTKTTKTPYINTSPPIADFSSEKGSRNNQELSENNAPENNEEETRHKNSSPEVKSVIGNENLEKQTSGKINQKNGNKYVKSKNDTIIEMKIKGRQQVEISHTYGEDDPPFNFQALLRKTSISRDSLRRNKNRTQTAQNKNMEQDYEDAEYSKTVFMKRKLNLANALNNKIIIEELYPGVFLQGEVANL